LIVCKRKYNKSINNFSSEVINDNDTLLSDNDSTNSSYSIADQRNKGEHNQQKIYPKQSKDLTHPNTNQQQKSLSNLSESLSENRPKPSFSIPHQHETREENDRLSSTSVSDLFKQITYTNKQKSHDLDSVSTSYSIPISVRSSVLLSEEVIDKDNKNHTQPLRTILTEKQLPVSSHSETKQLKNIINMDIKDQTIPININLPTKRTQSHLTDTQENQLRSTDVNDTFNQFRSTYDDM